MATESVMPGHGEPGHEHTDRCMSRVTIAWLDEMYDLAADLGYGHPSPHELLAYAAHAIAKAVGYVLTAEEYQRLLDEHAVTLDELAQARFDVEFDAIVAEQSITPPG